MSKLAFNSIRAENSFCWPECLNLHLHVKQIIIPACDKTLSSAFLLHEHQQHRADVSPSVLLSHLACNYKSKVNIDYNFEEVNFIACSDKL